MNFLNALHQLLGAQQVAPRSGAAPGGFPFKAGPAQQQSQPQQQQPQHAMHLPANMPYAQYMNADGSGGGFGANDPSAMNMGHNPNVQQQGYNLPQQGFGPQVQGLGSGPFHQQLQGGQRVLWQNTDGVRRNGVNPQIRDDGFNIF